MSSALHSLLVGGDRSDAPPYLVTALAFVGFVGTVAAYALEVFVISGGIVWIPFHAAVVGMCAGCLVGYFRRGLLFGWIVTYTALLGYRADHAFFGLSGRSLGEQAAYFFGPEGLLVLAFEAVVLGAIAFGLGWIARVGIDAFRSSMGESSVRKGN
ncbi:hypothetical protein HWV23_15235 [Natronomonas halophila]|uniref:hypothetical protein n=1 Tax=Natronomonas halophila TaxID=2747817 RepID=UPI0015B755AC|nr:hypothetical protein [Natronomonas halophila]QLD87019.1 hypothetical protein HWV23_15235 [Natronomonas halophila]